MSKLSKTLLDLFATGRRNRRKSLVGTACELQSLEQRRLLTGNPIVLIDSDFETEGLEIFDEVFNNGTTTRLTSDDSHGHGTRAIEVTYGDQSDEISMLASVYLTDHEGLSAGDIQSVEYSFSSRLPDGLPIDDVARGWGGLKQSRGFNINGIDGFNGVGDQLTKYNAGWQGGNIPATDQWGWVNVAGSHDKQTEVDLDPTEWYSVRYFAQRNTPGEADGIFMFWLNDQLIEESTNVTWPGNAEQWIDGVWIGGNLSLGGSTADEPFRRLIDNVYIAVNGDVPQMGGGDTGAVDFFSDFEGLDADCWDDHLTTGWSHLGSQSCDGFFEIGKGDAIRLVETDTARSGTHALQITYSDQENPDDNIGQAVYHLSEQADYVKTTQYMRFNDTHDFAYGQKIHRLYSMGNDERANFDMVVNAWGRSLDGRAETDMTGVNGTRFLSLNYGGGRDLLDWGTAESNDFSFERERWYKITSEVQLNTVGTSDGWVRLYVDDVLVAEKSNLLIRASADHRFNRVMFGGWYSNEAAGNNPSLAPAAPTSLLIDDVSIVTTPDAGNSTRTLVVTQSNGGTRVEEGGANDSVTVALSSAPDEDVIINVANPAAGDIIVSPIALTFTTANWNAPQTVTINAIDDDRLEGDQQATLSFSVAAGSDTQWLNAADQTINVTIIDNDQRDGQPGYQQGILVVPGTASQTMQLEFDWVQRRGEYDNELGFFVVDDLQGRINGLLPTDAGYAQATLRSASRRTIFASGQTQGAESTNNLPGGSLVVFYMVQNASTSEFLMDNPTNDAAATPIVFYSIPEANIDDFDHVRVTEPDDNVWQFGWEDLLNGGDQSFTDAVIGLSVTAADAGTANGYRQVVRSDSGQKFVPESGIIEIPVVYQTQGPNGQPAALRSNVISFNLHFDKDVLEFIDTINVLQEGLLVAPDTVRAETDPVVAGSDSDADTDSVLTASYSDNDGLTFPGWPNAPDAQGQVVFVARFRARPGLDQTSVHFTPNAVGTVTGERAEFEFASQSVTVSVSETSGDVDGDGDFDANDTFLIHTVMLSGSDQQVTQSLGASPLDAAQIRSNILKLEAAGDIDGDSDFDANDSFLLHLIKLSGSDAHIDFSKGASPLTAAQIRQNAAVLEGNLLQSINTPAIVSQPPTRVESSSNAFSLQSTSGRRRQTRAITEVVDDGATALVMSDELTEPELSTAWEDFREWLDRI